MADEEPRVTEQDVAALNRESLRTMARISHLTGNGLLMLAALGVLAWLWILLRQQQLLGDSVVSFGGFGSETGPLERVDILANSIGFVLNAALVAGLGFGLRLVADSVTVKAGGTLTGLDAGDPWPPAKDDADEWNDREGSPPVDL